MVRRFLCILLSLFFCLSAASGEGASAATLEDVTEYPPAEYTFKKSRVASYQSDTLIYTIESFTLDSIQCYLTKIWVKDPERQIRKVNAPWGTDLAKPMVLAKSVPEIVLAANASGYITERYPDIPESYPGTPEDYYFTTLGSLVITDGEVLRYLSGIPFYGLALSGNGIDLYRGADPETVLMTDPRQTWAFFEPCAMQAFGVDLLPETDTWPLADRNHRRTILARVNRNNYLLLHVRRNNNAYGLSLHRLNRFFSRHFVTEWVYNLDGGPSSALMYKTQKKNARLTLLAENEQRVADIIGFTE